MSPPASFDLKPEEQSASGENSSAGVSEGELRASEETYRRLFEAAQDGIFLLDPATGRIEDANPYLVKLLGFSRDEMVGRTVGQLSPFEDLVQNQAILQRLQREGYVRYENLPLKTRDGREIAVEFVSNVYLVGNRQVIQCNVRDITQRKQAEVATAQLAAIVESSGDAIIGKNLRSIVTSWNRGAEKIFGYSAEEMVGQSIMRLVPKDRRSEEDRIIQKIKNGEAVEHFETLRQARDGHLIPVSITVSPIRAPNGEIVGVSKVLHDISRQIAAEERILQMNFELERRVAERTAQLEVANRELEAFSYSVSHDLRAPLRHIVGFVELLKKEAAATLSETGRQYLATIARAGDQMGTLIADLLDFSRLASSVLEKREIDLDKLVSEAVADQQSDIGEREIVWKIHPLPQVQADPALLRQVLVNLISNAIKFTGNRTPAEIEIGSLPGTDETVIFIRDNGAGFDPNYSGKLFGVFQRLHSQAEFPGTGVGLANVQRMIHRHEGRVWAEGAIDGGATFFFSIPQFPATPPTANSTLNPPNLLNPELNSSNPDSL